MKLHTKIKPFSGRESIRKPVTLFAAAVAAIVVCFAFHSAVQQYVFKAVAETNRESVQKIESSSDYALEAIKNFCMQIYNDRNIVRLRTQDDLTQNETVYLIRQLYNYVTAGNFIDSIYIYNARKDYIYTTNEGNAPSARFADRGAVALFEQRASGQSLKPILRSGNRLSSTSSVKQIFSFLIFDTDIDGTPTDNAVMVNVKPSWYSDLFFGGKTDYPSCFVTRSLDVVASWDGTFSLELPESICGALREEFASGQTSGYVIGGRLRPSTVLCFYTYAGLDDWFYLRYGTYGEMFPYLLSMENVFTALLIATVALLLFLSFYFIIPYLRIRRSISQISETDIGYSTDDITEKLHKLIEMSVDARQLGESMGRMMREELIRSYLYGSLSDPVTAETLEEYQLPFSAGEAVTVLLVDRGTRVEEYLSELRPLCPRSDGVLMNGNHTVLLLQCEAPADRTELARRLFRRFGARFYVLSRPVSDWGELADTYRTLRRTALLFALQSSSYLIDCSSAEYAAALPDSELQERIHALLSRLRSGDAAPARSECEALLTYAASTDCDSALSCVNALRDQSIRLLNELKPENPYRAQRHESIESWLRARPAPEELRQFFHALFDEIVLCSADEKKLRAVKTADRVAELIRRDYTNPGLSAQSIADELGISYAYLSRIYHQATGQSISSEITRARLEEACRLLLRAEIPVKDIPGLVGFENQQYFYVLFKKQYNETPGQYRGRLLKTGAPPSPAPGASGKGRR